MSKKYFVAVSEAIIPAPFGRESLYPGITLVQEKRQQRVLEEFSKLEFGAAYVHSFISSVVMIENYQSSGNLHAAVKEYILYECPNNAGKPLDGRVPLDADAVGYSQMPPENK